MAPHVKVIAVEAEQSACLKAALETGERVKLEQVGLSVDGVAVAQIGELPFDVVRTQKSDNSGPIVEPAVITCTNDEVCSAVTDIFGGESEYREPCRSVVRRWYEHIYRKP